ncbi:MAG: sigma-70 family RNA polymerase sigma factor [Spirochaetota bacterium]
MRGNTTPGRESENRAIIEEFQRKGDDASFSPVYELYKDRIFYFILARVGSDETARDLFQEVMFKVYTILPKFDFRCKFETYLYRMINNLLIDRYRKIKRSVNMARMTEETEESIAETVGDDRVSIEDAMIDKEQMSVLTDELKALPVGLRSIMLMRFYDGLQYNEISDICGESLRNVKYKVEKACGLLRERMQTRGYHVTETQ